MNYRILIAEDDPNLGLLLSEFLNNKGYECTLAENGKTAYKEYMKQPYHLCLLDVMMPEMDGFTLAREIRKTNSEIPIIFLTVKSLKEDVVEGLKLGADDYLTKPFHTEELLLRINSVLKRTYANKSHVQKDIYDVGQLKFNYAKQELSKKDKVIRLSSKENELLYLLATRSPQTVKRSFLLNKIWKNDDYFTGRSMDVYLSKLRKHLKLDPGIEMINVHGEGYKLIC